MSDLFNPEFFAKLNKLNLAMNIRLDKGMSGSRKSSAKGSSVEFSDFREYLPGDDIRRIDWNVYGRLDKLYIKQFMEEQEAFYHIFVDTSSSMEYGQQKKSFMTLRLAAVFGWLVKKQLDRYEILTVKDGRLGKTRPGHLFEELESIEFGGGTQLGRAVRSCSFRGKGICIILSDFLESEGIDEAVKFLTYKGQDIMLVQILAREEVEFQDEGTLALTDMESGEEVRVTINRNTIKAYHEALERHNTNIERLARKYGCHYVSVVSDEDIEKVVFETLKKKGIFG